MTIAYQHKNLWIMKVWKSSQISCAHLPCFCWPGHNYYCYMPVIPVAHSYVQQVLLLFYINRGVSKWNGFISLSRGLFKIPSYHSALILIHYSVHYITSVAMTNAPSPFLEPWPTQHYHSLTLTQHHNFLAAINQHHNSLAVTNTALPFLDCDQHSITIP